jgi:cell division protein FtsB
MGPFGIITCIVVICVSIFLAAKWYGEMLAETIRSEHEEKLERENAQLKRILKETKARNKRLEYERTHTRIEIKEI